MARLRELAGELDVPEDIRRPMLAALDRIERPPIEQPPPMRLLQLSKEDWMAAHPSMTYGKRQAMLNNVSQINDTLRDHWPAMLEVLNDDEHAHAIGADLVEVADWLTAQSYEWWLDNVRSDHGLLPMRKHVRGKSPQQAGAYLAEWLNDVCRRVYNDIQANEAGALIRTQAGYRWEGSGSSARDAAPSSRSQALT